MAESEGQILRTLDDPGLELFSLRPPERSAAFPDERGTVTAIREAIQADPNFDALNWGIAQGIIIPGGVVVAEVSPTLRCPLNCEGCPDAFSNVQMRIRSGEIPRTEPRAGSEIMLEQMRTLAALGVEHVMLIGGTIDQDELTPLLAWEGLDSGMKVSWFTDMIPETQEDGNPSRLLESHLENGWIRGVSTHVSLDYPHPRPDQAFSGNPDLTPKAAGTKAYRQDQDASRRFKSEYGFVGSLNLIRKGVPQIFYNTTIAPSNVGELAAIYEQVLAIEEYARSIGSPTEILWTFSPWVWRPHQARGDDLRQSPASSGLQEEHMDTLNAAMSNILADTYARLREGKSRILANSSGYTALHADPRYRQAVVDQAVPYREGRPEIFDITPDGKFSLDPMFRGPELAHVNSTFGYRDRDPRQEANPFSQFQPADVPWFPNLVALPVGSNG